MVCVRLLIRDISYRLSASVLARMGGRALWQGSSVGQLE